MDQIKELICLRKVHRVSSVCVCSPGLISFAALLCSSDLFSSGSSACSSARSSAVSSDPPAMRSRLPSSSNSFVLDHSLPEQFARFLNAIGLTSRRISICFECLTTVRFLDPSNAPSSQPGKYEVHTMKFHEVHSMNPFLFL